MYVEPDPRIEWMGDGTAEGGPSRPGAGSRPDTIRGRTSRLKATTHVQLACWKRQGEDAPVENRGEHELKGVPDRWRLYRVVN